MNQSQPTLPPLVLVHSVPGHPVACMAEEGGREEGREGQDQKVLSTSKAICILGGQVKEALS